MCAGGDRGSLEWPSSETGHRAAVCSSTGPVWVGSAREGIIKGITVSPVMLDVVSHRPHSCGVWIAGAPMTWEMGAGGVLLLLFNTSTQFHSLTFPCPTGDGWRRISVRSLRDTSAARRALSVVEYTALVLAVTVTSHSTVQVQHPRRFLTWLLLIK